MSQNIEDIYGPSENIVENIETIETLAKKVNVLSLEIEKLKKIVAGLCKNEESNLFEEKKPNGYSLANLTELAEKEPKHKRSEKNQHVSTECKIKCVTKNAILVELKNMKQFWVPKSTIEGLDQNLTVEQDIVLKIADWILKRNNV